MRGLAPGFRNADLELERYVLQELPPAGMARVAARAASDPAVRSRLDELRRSALDITERYPAAIMAAAIRQRLGATGAANTRRWAGWRWPAAACAVVVAAVALGVPLARPTPSGESTDRTKGAGPALVVYRWAPQGAELLAPAATAGPGDRLRIGYRAEGYRFGAIFSSDGAGVVTQHLPASGDLAVELGGTATALVDGSFELDDAPSWERFYFLAANDAFDLERVRTAMKAVARAGSADAPPALTLPYGVQQVVFSVTKRDTR